MKNDPFPNASFSTHVLIAAAGSGKRAGGDKPKQYQLVNGKTILRYTIEKFLIIPSVTSLRVIIDPSHQSMYEESVEGLALPAPVVGGKTRKESIFNGLMALAEKEDVSHVLIHDAARPFVSAENIHEVIEALKEHKAVTLAVRVANTLRNDTLTIDREGLWSVQTPQGFYFPRLLEAHKHFQDEDGFTDDASLVEAMGEKVAIVKGSRINFKITTQEDWEMAEKLLANTETRTGMGFDVHAFDKVPSSFIRLCGVDIPFDKKLKGHSDADVGLHALTDALLGAIAEGDIGVHFPPSDPEWKDAESSMFLFHAAQMVRQMGGTIRNVDITLICEKPKILPYRESMRQKIAEILAISISRVSVKATTTEQLGFTGREEGIAAQAIANITLPVHTEQQ